MSSVESILSFLGSVAGMISIGSFGLILGVFVGSVLVALVIVISIEEKEAFK